MKREKCGNCNLKDYCQDSATSWIFFGIGILAALAIRAVTVLDYFEPVYGKLAWYIGVIFFCLFFIYKFKVLLKKARFVKKYNLAEALNSGEKLSGEQKNFLSELVCSINSNKERINYFVIFVLSAIAVVIALYLDFIN